MLLIGAGSLLRYALEIAGGQGIKVDDLFAVTAKTTAKTITNERAKWRNRVVSVFESLNTGQKVSVAWTDANEMLVSIAEASDEA